MFANGYTLEKVEEFAIKFGTFEIQNNIEIIGTAAFRYLESLKNIEIPENVMCIESDAFNNCIYLEKCIIRNPNCILEQGIFWNCVSLKNVELPSNLEEIPSHAFAFCEKLRKITIPKSVRKIGESAFQGCKSLREIEIPDDVERIHFSQFTLCSKLKKIHFHGHVYSIDDLMEYKEFA